MNRAPAIAVTNVTFGYSAEPVVKNVSFEAESGRILGILGPNGAGKSSLIRLIAGLQRPRLGTIRVDGDDIDTLERRDIARRIALAPQDGHLPTGFTVEHCVLMGRTPWLGSFGAIERRDRAKTAEAMAAARVSHLADRIVETLSGGERQRVVIARALAQEAHTLLLDEPTSHLDLANQSVMIDLAIECARDRNVCVIAVFHDVNLAAHACDDLLFVRDGEIVAKGAPEVAFTSATIEAVFGVAVLSIPGPVRDGLPIIVPNRLGTPSLPRPRVEVL